MRDPLFWAPVKFKLPLTFVSICLVAFGVGGFVVTDTAQEALEAQIRKRLDERALATGLVVGHHLALVGRRAEDFASDGYIRSAVEALARGEAGAADGLRTHLVVNKLPIVDAFVDAAILDASGRVILNVHGGAQGRSVTHTAFTPLHEAGALRDYPSFAVATPLRDLKGTRRIGTLILQVEADRWVAGMTKLRQLPRVPGAYVAIGSAEGSRLNLVGERIPEDAVSYASVIPESGWNLTVAADRAAIAAPIRGLRDRFLWIAAVLLGLTGLVLFFPVQFLLAPLGRIREAALRISAGDTSVRVGYASKDEIGDLSRAFDSMAEALARREESLRLERDRLDSVLRSMRDGLFLIDSQGQVSFSNEAARPLVDALRGENALLERGCDRADGEDCMGCLQAAGLPRHACTIRVGGRVYEVHVSPLPGASAEEPGRLCVSRDITERIAQARVQAHQERMSVLGNISAVMAHELNNPLAAIAMFSQMLEGQLEEGTASRESAEVIRRNAETCKRTIRGLLDTAVHAPPESVEFDLDELVEDVRRFLRPIWERAGVEFRIERGEEAAGLVGDELQLRQVLINLVMNAVQAMDDGGSVTLRTRSDDLGWRIEVSDDGPGIPDELRDRIFEPFFTTKPPSVGTGLGLSTSRRIITAHGGSLDLQATGPDGTTFVILLPRSASPVEAWHA